jgi:hypothetical protein
LRLAPCALRLAPGIEGVLSTSSGSKRSRYGSEYGGANRDPAKQTALRKEVDVIYNKKGIITGEEENVLKKLTAAHVVSLKDIAGLGSQYCYTTANCVLMEDLIEKSFDRHEWYFDLDKKIHVLWEFCPFKTMLEAKATLELPSEEKGGPAARVIEYKIKLATEYAKEACPVCWAEKRNIDEVRMQDHKRLSCSETKEEQMRFYCDICDVSCNSESTHNAHLIGRKHKNKLETHKIVFSGSVQGVGFRNAVATQAAHLGILGTIHNDDDKKVSLLAQTLKSVCPDRVEKEIT